MLARMNFWICGVSYIFIFYPDCVRYFNKWGAHFLPPPVEIWQRPHLLCHPNVCTMDRKTHYSAINRCGENYIFGV